MSDNNIQVTKKKATKKKTTKKSNGSSTNNILEVKIKELKNTVIKFEKLQEEYNTRLIPLIHNFDDLIEYSPDRKNEQLSSVSNDITQMDAELSGVYAVLVNLLDNLEI